MRRFYLVLAIMAVAGSAAPRVQADDDEIAQHIYQVLKTEQENGNLRGYRVDMRVDKGTVWFKGHVSNADQEMLILRTAQQAGRMGVVQVVDDIEVRQPAASVMDVSRMETKGQQPALPVSFSQQTERGAPAMDVSPMESMGQQTALPVAFSQQTERGAPAMDVSPMESMGQQPALPVAFSQQTERGAPAMQATIQTAIPATNEANIRQPGPTAVSQAPVNVSSSEGAPMPVAYSGGMGITTDNPQLPGYAWPAYASHPNYAAVSYPQQYSASAWPYIGPFYPYPQVPLGWRKVTMEWDDGWWYLDFNDR